MNSKQVLVIGAGRFGLALATTLYDLGHEVVVIDNDEDAVEDIMNNVTQAMIADATDEDVLRKVGCGNFDTVVIAIGDDLESNILATVAAKSVGTKHVISKAKDAIAAKVLARVGADKVVRPEHDMGVKLAEQISTPSVLDALDFGDDHEVVEIEVPSKLAGLLADLRLPKRFGVQILTINRGGEITVTPQGDFVIRAGDKVLLLGENRAIEKLQNHLND